jgi:hypothetical protein
MAFRGKNRHYEWDKVRLRHFRETALRCSIRVLARRLPRRDGKKRNLLGDIGFEPMTSTV